MDKYTRAVDNLTQAIREKKGTLDQLNAFAKANVPASFLAKNSLTIVNKAAAYALMYNISPEKTIRAETNPLAFQQLVKRTSQYDYLEQDGEKLKFDENRIIATLDPTGAIYKFKAGKITPESTVPDIFETTKKGTQKLIPAAKKMFNT